MKEMVLIDAENLIMGRLASHVATRLLKGEEITIVNAEKTIITGSKKQILANFRQKRRVGGERKGPYYPRMPDRILKRTIRGMIPIKKPSGRAAHKRLRVYIGVPKDLMDQKTSTVKQASAAGKIKYVELGEVSRELGAKF